MSMLPPTALSSRTDRPLTAPAIAADAVTAIAPSDRLAKPCASVVGLLREACIEEDDLWIGMVSSEPHTASVWHDHGDRTTYVLPLAGAAVVEFGPNGEERLELRCDGTLYVVPPHLKHREVNPSDTPFRAFLIRVAPKAATPRAVPAASARDARP